MSLITDISEVEKEIGGKRAGAVAEFRKLVDGRQYHEAREYLKRAGKIVSADLRRYAEIHLRELQTSGL